MSLPKRLGIRVLFLVMWEGLNFLGSIRCRGWHLLPPRSYLMWRLGTVYGSHHLPDADGERKAKSLRDLLGNLWKDRAQAIRFLMWCRQMRRKEMGRY